MFYLIQLLNGVQYGLLLFLLASGLTLIFGIMGVINLAHGSFYMVGAYLAYWLAGITGSFWLALPLGVGTALVIGVLLEVTLFSRLYKRDHLYQVLLTFGLILIFEELRSILFGDDVHGVTAPAVLRYPVRLACHRTRRHPRQSARSGVFRNGGLFFDGYHSLVATPRARQQDVTFKWRTHILPAPYCYWAPCCSPPFR